MARGRGTQGDLIQIVALTLFLSSGVFAIIAIYFSWKESRAWGYVQAVEQGHAQLQKLLRDEDLHDLIRRVREREASGKQSEGLEAAVVRLTRGYGLVVERSGWNTRKQYDVKLKPAELTNIVRFLAALKVERPDIFITQLSVVPQRPRGAIGAAAAPVEGPRLWQASMTFGSFATLSAG